MGLEIIMLSDMSVKDKYCMISLKQTNIYAKQKQTHRHRKQTSGYQRGEGRVREN